MLTEVPSESRTSLAPLFENYPGWHGLIPAVLEGAMGQAFADSPTSPTLAVLTTRYDYFVGGPNSDRSAVELFRFLPEACFFVVPPGWNKKLEREYAQFITPERRVSFGSGDWDRPALRRFIETVPPEFSVQRVTADNLADFVQVAPSGPRNFGSSEEFLERGAGFGVLHSGKFVAGCASFAAGSRTIEIDTETRPDYRRRGFAQASAAAMIEHCLANQIEPCWDAANEASARLASTLGFSEPRPYTAYYLHPVPVEDATPAS